MFNCKIYGKIYKEQRLVQRAYHDTLIVYATTLEHNACMAEYKFSRVSPYPSIAGRRVKLAREESQLRQEDLARMISLTKQAVSNYEQGTREMTAETAVKMSRILHQHPAYLIGLVDELDHSLLMLPAETRMHLASAFQIVQAQAQARAEARMKTKAR